MQLFVSLEFGRPFTPFKTSLQLFACLFGRTSSLLWVTLGSADLGSTEPTTDPSDGSSQVLALFSSVNSMHCYGENSRWYWVGQVGLDVGMLNMNISQFWHSFEQMTARI